MVIKCPSDGCSWTGELRNKEVRNQEHQLYPRHRVDSVRVKHDHFQIE